MFPKPKKDKSRKSQITAIKDFVNAAGLTELRVIEIAIFTLIICAFATTTLCQDTPLPPIWRIPSGQNETLIADLDEPATYQICFPQIGESEWYGYINVILDGGLYRPALTPGSCMLVKGRNIGLRKSPSIPPSVNNFTGNYERVFPSINWSTPIKWTYFISPNNSATPTTYPISLGARGIFRICQKGEGIFDSNGNPVRSVVGFYVVVDDITTQLQLQSQPNKEMRFEASSCIDVDGKNVNIAIIKGEIKPNTIYRPEGTFRFAPDGVAQ